MQLPKEMVSNLWLFFNALDDETRTLIIALGLIEMIDANFKGDEREGILALLFGKKEGNKNVTV